MVLPRHPSGNTQAYLIPHFKNGGASITTIEVEVEIDRNHWLMLFTRIHPPKFFFHNKILPDYLSAIIFTTVKEIAPSGNRIYGLDILRAIAVMLVMHVHGQHFIDAYVPYTYYWWLVFDGV